MKRWMHFDDCPSLGELVEYQITSLHIRQYSILQTFLDDIETSERISKYNHKVLIITYLKLLRNALRIQSKLIKELNNIKIIII